MSLIDSATIHHLQSENRRLAAELAAAKKEIDHLEVEVECLEGDLRCAEVEEVTLEKRIERLEEENLELEKEMENFRTDNPDWPGVDNFQEYEGHFFVANNELQRLCFEAFIDCLNEKSQVWLLQHLRYLINNG